MSGKPGLLFVCSYITSPALTTDTFAHWYEDVHVPDMLATSGVTAAFRYKAADRPVFLALYPVQDVGWLSSDEFLSVPVHSDVLPNKGGSVFEVAHFDTRKYRTLGKRGGDGRKGPAHAVVLVAFDSESQDVDCLFAESWPKTSAPVRSRILELDGTLGPAKAGGVPSRYMVLHEYDRLPDTQDLCSTPGLDVSTFELIGAFGDIEGEF